MVEKWLVLVEKIMIQSMKDVTAEAVAAYNTMDRSDWLLSFPGQVRKFFNFANKFINLCVNVLGGTMWELHKLDHGSNRSYN